MRMRNGGEIKEAGQENCDTEPKDLQTHVYTYNYTQTGL